MQHKIMEMLCKKCIECALAAVVFVQIIIYRSFLILFAGYMTFWLIHSPFKGVVHAKTKFRSSFTHLKVSKHEFLSSVEHKRYF